MSIAGKLKKIFIIIILSEITQSPRHTWCVLTLRQADTLMGLELAVQENRHKSLFSLTVQIHNSLEKSVTGKKQDSGNHSKTALPSETVTRKGLRQRQ